jgi:hypothetical protein
MAGFRGRVAWLLAAAVGGVGALFAALWSIPRADPLDRGWAAYASGDWQGARGAAIEAIKRKGGGDDPAALRLLARASARSGNDRSADAIYRQLGAQRLESEDLFLLGRGLLKNGPAGPGVVTLRAALDADSNNAEALDALSKHLAATGALTEAETLAARLARQPGWQMSGNVRLGLVRRDLLDDAGAAPDLATALRRDPSLKNTGVSPEKANNALVRSLLALRRPTEALDAARSLTGPEAAWLRSRALLQQGKIIEAEAAIEASEDFGEHEPLMHDPSPFAGAARCASCHQTKYVSQQKSRHAQTLRRPFSLFGTPWPTETLVDRANPQVSHTFHWREDKVWVTTRVGDQVFSGLIDYALGSNHQGQTFLAKDGVGQVRELRISRYPQEPVWDRTMEHPAIPPETAGYFGRPVDAEALRLCLGCHATTSRAASHPTGRPEAADQGIGCERCHGPGENHALAAEAEFSQQAIARPRLATPARVVALCAECHRAPGSADADDPRSIRFQGPTFVRSRCYTETREGFSCVTCHDPHRDAERSESFYEAKCLACHSSGKSQARAAKLCPVNAKKDCLGCHMPRITNAVPRTVFTDHHIRIRLDSGR